MAENRKDDLDIQEPEFECAAKEQNQWEQGYYGTGCTTPPKDHAGVVALVLVLLILCSGLTMVLSMLDIHLFGTTQPTEPKTPASFSAISGTIPQGLEIGEAETTEPAQESTAPISPEQPHTDLQLKPSPDDGKEETPETGELSWQDVYEKVIPSVVSITTTQPSGKSSGTGVVMSSDGYIITNAHVVEGAQTIQVMLTDGRVFDAGQVGLDGVSDLAVLYIEAKDLTAAEFGNSDTLRVGDQVVAIGDPLGIQLRGTMTDGMISAINRDLKIGGKTMTLLQTTAALNSGNSGGPLVNSYGQVIGINTMKIGDYASTSGVEGLGFAIPMTAVKSVVEQLMTDGYISGRPTLGIKGQMVSSFYQYYYRLPVGLLITEVTQDSDAEHVGIRPGDLLLSINGSKISSYHVLEELLYGMSVGDTVEAVIYRSGRQYDVELTVEELKR